ncbi:hypothetical protein [uncultured Campylobacter sp.]|uniref:hypothetical protein n=1 Tax=uncultured Campylobacter sp. TaxID=218934 RepID=UPI0026287B22|nr:hypothetical protein [uncultured Campylobacter sp.]
MYEKKDLTLLKIIQKARQFNDTELSSEFLLKSLLAQNLSEIKDSEKAYITELLNNLVEAKKEASLSK